MRFVLASASPARLETLRRAGIQPSVIVSDVDESVVSHDDVRMLVGELARLKAEAVASQVGDDDVVVVGCDSLLELNGEACGKPGSPEAAAALWRRTSGRTARLLTGHHVIVTSAGATRTAARTAATTVHFAALTEAEIEAYAATGEPEAVAGGFTIDGYGGAFVEGIEGDHSNVIGISLPLLRTMLAELGVSWVDLWAPSA